MINQYRTLLINLTDQEDPNEYIAPNFTALKLPIELQNFYNLLFPYNASRFYTEFLAYCYLQILKGANQQQFIYNFDSRVTYSLDVIQQYFLINQISQPIVSNFNFPINVLGSYTVNSSTSENFEDILISQVSTIYVSVYSKTNNVYYNETSTSPVLTSDYTIKLTNNLSQNTSDLIKIADTGLSFVISGNFVDFVDYNNLTWEFIAQAPFNFNFAAFFNTLLTNLPTVDKMLAYNPAVVDTNSINLWKMHYNPVYRFAGLLNSYMLKVNSLLTS